MYVSSFRYILGGVFFNNNLNKKFFISSLFLQRHINNHNNQHILHSNNHNKRQYMANTIVTSSIRHLYKHMMNNRNTTRKLTSINKTKPKTNIY